MVKILFQFKRTDYESSSGINNVDNFINFFGREKNCHFYLNYSSRKFFIEHFCRREDVSIPVMHHFSEMYSFLKKKFVRSENFPKIWNLKKMNELIPFLLEKLAWVFTTVFIFRIKIIFWKT